MNSIFCLNRMIIGISTGLFETTSIVPCIYALFGGTIFQLGFHLRFSPMRYSFASKIEKGNLVMIYFSSYSLLLFSNWISDIELNYSLGSMFTNFFISFCVAYGFIIVWDLSIKLIKRHRINLYEKRLKLLK